MCTKHVSCVRLSYLCAVFVSRSDVSDFSHVLGVQTQDLLKAPTLKDHLQHEMVDQLPYLHFFHWCVRLLHLSVCSALHTYPVLTLILDFEQFLAVYLWQCERGHWCVWESFGNYYKVGVNSHTLARVSKVYRLFNLSVYSLLNAYRWRVSRSCAL